MVPLQYIINTTDLDAALACGCHWLQLADSASASAAQLTEWLGQCHTAGCYLVLTDDVDTCAAIAADGVVLTTEGIAAVASKVPEPTGIVLQRPRPVTLAIAEARKTLGEESPQFVGVQVHTAEDAVAAAKAGADFIQVPLALCPTLLQAVRERSFTTPIVALDVLDAEAVSTLLDKGVSGIACNIGEVPPVMIPLLLNADE